MKKFLKKANRGIILACIISFIVVVYVAIDYISFASEKSKVNDTVTNYYTEILELNTKYKEWSKDSKDAFYELVDNYWSDAKSSLDWCTKKGSFMDEISYLFDDDNAVLNVSSAKCNIQNTKIKKIGPGYASVTFSYNVSVDGLSTSYFVTPSTIRSLSETDIEPYYDYDDMEHNNQQNTEGKNGTLTYSADATIQLHKENGKWKIIAIDAYENNSSFIEAE